MRSIKRVTSMCMFISFLSLIFTGMSFAEENYPIKPVSILIPYSPGGGSDTINRVVADIARKYFPKSLIIVNRPGASGTRAVYDLVKSKPDGYTVAFVSNSEAAAALHLIPAKYTPDDYTIICHFGVMPTIILTTGPWNNLKDLIDYARKNPAKMKCGVAGLGGESRLTLEWFASQVGIKFKVVPFQGAGPLIPAVLGGHVEIGITHTPQIMALYRARELKVITIFSDKRSKVLPDIPTAKEQGFDISSGTQHYYIVPNDVPKTIREKLNSLMKKVIGDPEFQKKAHLLAYSAYYEDAQTSRSALKEWYDVTGKLYGMLGMIKKK